MKTTSRLKSGFTLIELLVVITIIAILAAVLFPVFASVRDKARASACLSNQKQIALAFLQYTQDYDETVAGAGGADRVWGYLYPYIKNKQVFFCPSDTNKGAFANAGQVYVSYASNFDVFFAFSSASKPLQMSQFNQPSISVLSFENTGKIVDPSSIQTGGVPTQTNYSCNFANTNAVCQGVDTGRLGGMCSYTNPVPVGSAAAACGGAQCCYSLDQNAPQGRHQSGSNYMLCDGHAKWMPGSRVSAGGNTTNHGYENGVASAAGYWADGTATAQNRQEITFSVL